VKRRMRLAMGYRSFRTAWRPIQGIEAMHMIRKGRVRRVPKDDIVAQIRFIHNLFGLPSSDKAAILLPQNLCNTTVTVKYFLHSARRSSW
jgi:hypothetical protein